MEDPQPKVVSSQGSARTWLQWAFAFLATLAFSFPLLLLIAAKGYYLPFSAESLVYRYFASMRIVEGEGGTVFLPQGQLVTLLQNGIVAALRWVPGLGLEQTLELFSTCTSLVVSLAMFGVNLATLRDESLTLVDKAIVLVLGPATVLGTVNAGFYYTLLPDYLALDLPIISASVYLALRCLRAVKPSRTIDIATIGALAGIAAANKPTLLGPIGIVALLVIIRVPVTVSSFLRRTVLAGFAAVAGYLLIFSAAYLFHLSDTIRALGLSMRFLRDAGEEPNFWEGNFRFFTREYGYGNIAIAWLAATLFCIVETVRLKRRSTAVLVLANIFVAGLLGAALLKRGAGTTFFEASSILAGLAALMLAAGLGLCPRGRWVWLIPAGITMAAAAQFDYRHNWFVVTKGGELGRAVWRARDYALHFNEPIVAIIPDRSYFTGSIEELLETSFFLSGFEPASSVLQARFIPRTTFRTEVGVVQSGTTLVWLEKWDPVSNRPLKETDKNEAKRWATLTRLAGLNPSRSWRAGYAGLGLINVMSINRLK